MSTSNLDRHRRHTNRVVILIACIVAAVGAGRSLGGTRPNIVVVMADDAGYNNFGFNQEQTGGVSNFETPNLDELARQNVVVTAGYASSPVCSPSRAGLMTGQHQSRYGYENNILVSSSSTSGLPAGHQTIARELKELGYATGAIGKWHLGAVSGVNRPFDVGFDEFFGYLDGARSYFYLPSANERTMMRRGDSNVENQWRYEGDTSRYDPVRGRYLTDAFGEEAVDFINRHSAADTPFFLYVSMPAPHSPSEATQQDLDRFSHLESVGGQLKAAMIWSLDRAVGDIMGALQTNGIDDNTIFVFTNDHGAPYPQDNFPFYGHKGSMWEGGLRVPFVVKAPGLQAGTYDRPISTLDLLPTFVAAAGGDLDDIQTDGVNVLPYLAGDAQGDPHEIMLWRSVGGKFVVRKGDMKLVKIEGIDGPRLFDLATDRRERTNLYAQHSELVAELLRELTYWEATLDKPRWGSFGDMTGFNQFDHFVFDPDHAEANWSDSGAWLEAGTDNLVTMRREDAYANMILEFSVTNTHDFTSTNDMVRSTLQTYMLNELRLTGTFDGATDHGGTINGNALLLVQNRDGLNPRIELAATSNSDSSRFAFSIENELQLLHDLEITGEGTQDFIIHGDIRDYFEARSVVKSGSSRLTLSGQSTYTGSLTVEGGEVVLNEPGAAVTGPSSIIVGANGQLRLEDGTISVMALDNSQGGSFDFTGGHLSAVNIVGSLANHGGTFAPGASPALATIDGDFLQSQGTLEIEIGGPIAGDEHDLLQVAGTANLSGILNVALINDFVPELGSMFTVLMADTIINSGLGLSPEADAVFNLRILDGESDALVLIASEFLAGDYNSDGIVNAADYVVWRNHFGQSGMPGMPGDGDDGSGTGTPDGIVDLADFDFWKTRFGNESGNNSNVPEPCTLLSAIVALCVICFQARFPKLYDRVLA